VTGCLYYRISGVNLLMNAKIPGITGVLEYAQAYKYAALDV
jgi:hypothetical protein